MQVCLEIREDYATKVMKWIFIERKKLMPQTVDVISDIKMDEWDMHLLFISNRRISVDDAHTLTVNNEFAESGFLN